MDADDPEIEPIILTINYMIKNLGENISSNFSSLMLAFWKLADLTHEKYLEAIDE